jgi:hypothetical protein
VDRAIIVVALARCRGAHATSGGGRVSKQCENKIEHETRFLRGKPLREKTTGVNRRSSL